MSKGKSKEVVVPTTYMLPAESVVTPFAASDPEPPYVCDVSVWADMHPAETTRNAQIEREESFDRTAQNSTQWSWTRCPQFIMHAIEGVGVSCEFACVCGRM